jgi:hypothetical protein
VGPAFAGDAAFSGATATMTPFWQIYRKITIWIGWIFAGLFIPFMFSGVAIYSMNLDALRFNPRRPDAATGHVIPFDAVLSRYGGSVRVYVTSHFYTMAHVFEYVIFGFFSVFALFIILCIIGNRHQSRLARNQAQADFADV